MLEAVTSRRTSLSLRMGRTRLSPDRHQLAQSRLEPVEFRAFEQGPAGEIDSERIDRRAVATNFVVKMWAGRQAG